MVFGKKSLSRPSVGQPDAHARAQTSDIGLDPNPKLVRWVAEILLLDGSEIRSLSGHSATLGDSFSRKSQSSQSVSPSHL